MSIQQRPTEGAAKNSVNVDPYVSNQEPPTPWRPRKHQNLEGDRPVENYRGDPAELVIPPGAFYMPPFLSRH